MLLLECDILVPGAIEDQITADNAGDIRTKMVLELANEAVTDQGAEILKKRNIPLIPGIAANTGGVVASFIEWSRNRGARPHKVDLINIQSDVEHELCEIMTNIIRKTYAKSIEDRLTIDESADVIAVETLMRQLKKKHSY